jgi:colicin import membrane protein
MRPNGGVVALAAINGPGAYARHLGESMAKKRPARKPKSKSRPKSGLRARVVKTRGGGARILFAKKKSAPKSRAKRASAKKPAARRAAKRPSTKRKTKRKSAVGVMFRKNAKRKKKAMSAEDKALLKHRRLVRQEASYKKRASKTPQYRTVTKKKKVKARVAYGPYRRYRSPKLGMTYGYQTPKGKVRKIPAWAIAGAPSASAYAAGAKYDAAKERFKRLRMAVGGKVGKKFDLQLKRQKAALEKLAKAQARELNKIAEGKSIMAPNRRRKRKKGKRKASRAKRPVARRTKKRSMRRSGRRKTAAKRRPAARRRRRTLYSRRRTVTRRKKRGKGKLTRGSFKIQHTFRRGRRVKTKRYTLKYKAKRGARGRLLFVPPGAGRSRKRQRKYSFTANGRKRKYSHSLRRRKSFRRNGTFSPFMDALKMGAPVLGGLAGHRVITGLLASAVASYLPIPEAFKVPAVGVAVAILGSLAAKAAVKGQAGQLIGVGMAVSSLHQLVMAGLNAAGQQGAASYLAGIPTQRTTSYGMGAYELIGGGGMSGFGSVWAARGNYLDVPSLGALPYSQAAAGYGALPYSQAAAGYGAFPEQAAAGYGAYPEQAAAGYGSYELTEGGVTLNGIGTSDAEIERALDVGDRQASVGFGDDTVGRTNITNPDGAYAPVSGGGQLPMVDGNFGGNVFGVGF